MNEYDSYKILCKQAKFYGYSINHTSTISSPMVNHNRKAIYLKPNIDETCLVSFCHELGHVIDRSKNRKIRNRKSTTIRFYDEIIAWCYGYRLSRRCGLSSRLYFKRMVASLFSYATTRGGKIH